MYTYENEHFTKEQIIAIAKNQKYVLIFLLFRIISYLLMCGMAGNVLEQLFRLLALMFSILTVIFFVKLMIALKTAAVWVVIRAVLSFIPIIGLVVLLVVNSKATKVLKSAGIEIGLLGAS
ncbi:MAG: hypothetical protein J6Y92_11555 [Lentisphaeria bacterium]|nr:hypothetical protein [Lentisphaeria bacterium]